MTDPTYDAESHHTPESRDRDARFVGHDVKVDTSKEAVWLIMKRDLYYRPEGKGYTGVKKDAGRFPLEETAVHFPDCDDHGISFIHEDDAPEFSKACFEDIARKVLSDERDALLAERAEVIKLREENERLRGTLVWVADVTSHSMGLTKNEERAINKVVTSALKGEQP